MVLSNDTGINVLNVISKANHFNTWMFETIRPYVTGNILEIGSGTGNISAFFIEAGEAITLSDVNPDNLSTLTQKFNGIQNVKGIHHVNLEKKDFATAYPSLHARFDSVFLLNVLEHIENDILAISNCNYLLKPGGTLVILTPSYSWLFSTLDKELGHYRRYTTKRLSRIVSDEGMNIKTAFYFNSIGIVAWLYAKLRKLKTIPETEMGMFNHMVKIGKVLDTISFKKIGLSTIVVGKKHI